MRHHEEGKRTHRETPRLSIPFWDATTGDEVGTNYGIVFQFLSGMRPHAPPFVAIVGIFFQFLSGMRPPGLRYYDLVVDGFQFLSGMRLITHN